MKSALFVFLLTFGFFANAASYTVYEGQTQDGTRFQVTSESPRLDGGTIKYLNLQINVNGHDTNLRGSAQLWPILTKVCDGTDFKHVYTVSRHAGFFESAVSIEKSGLQKSRGDIIVQHLFCMEQAY